MHGVADATEHLAEYCRQNSSIQVNQVFTPRCGDTVDSTGERYIYQVSDQEEACFCRPILRARSLGSSFSGGKKIAIKGENTCLC